MKTAAALVHVLSIRQPWAWLIVHGWKRHENRTWRTPYRGPLAVHAGSLLDRPGLEWVRRHCPDIPLPEPRDFPKGAIVGAVELVTCESDLAGVRGAAGMADLRFIEGPYVFTLARPRSLLYPIPARGRLGIYTVPRELLGNPVWNDPPRGHL